MFLVILIIDLYFLLPKIIAKHFNPTKELIMPIGIPTKEAKIENKTHPVIEEANVSRFNITKRLCERFCIFQFVLV